MSWKSHLDKVGIVGSLIAVACCLGLPAALSIVAAIGLGFIVHDAVLLPLLIFFLGITLLGLWFGYRVHRQPWALVLAGVSALALFFSIFVPAMRLVAYTAVFGLVGASVLNVMFRRKLRPGL